MASSETERALARVGRLSSKLAKRRGLLLAPPLTLRHWLLRLWWGRLMVGAKGNADYRLPSPSRCQVGIATLAMSVLKFHQSL